MKKHQEKEPEKKGRKCPAAPPKPIIPPDPERGQGYLNNAEQMLLNLFEDVRKIVNDTGLTPSQRISASEVGLSCCQAMQGLKYPPDGAESPEHDYWNCDDAECEKCHGADEEEEEE